MKVMPVVFPAGELLIDVVFALFAAVVVAGRGDAQNRLTVVASSSAAVTTISRIVPPIHNANSICPGRSSHQRTRSAGWRNGERPRVIADASWLPYQTIPLPPLRS